MLQRTFKKKSNFEETVLCEKCGEEFTQDIIWSRDFRIRAGKTRLSEESFFRMCPAHKCEYYCDDIVAGLTKRVVTDRDVEKMEIPLEVIWDYLKLMR